MVDFMLTNFMHLLIIGAAAGMLSSMGIAKLDLLMLGRFSLVYTLYFFITFLGGDYITDFNLPSDLKWNWSGKILSILLILCLWYLYKDDKEFNVAAAGFTLHQKNVSLALGVLSILILIPFAFSKFDPQKSDMETLAFQALMPGMSEEPMFRGILLLLLCKALISKSIIIFRAPFDCGCLLAVLLFGIGHGLVIENSKLIFSANIILGTSITGALLMWFRLITGSLLIPILLHNFINFSRITF